MALRVGERLPVDAICVGLAGVAGRPTERALMEGRVGAERVAAEVLIVADYEVAFRDAFGQGDGILIIGGTGSVAVGGIGDGAATRIGGWGALLGDEGSGYRLGLGGIRVAVRSAEGRNPPTALTGRLLGTLKAQSIHDVFEWSKTATKADVASLAPLVIEEADRGDSAASEIVTRAVEGLVQHADALAPAAGPEARPEVALVGGLIEPGGLLRPRVLRALQHAGFRTLTDHVIPVRGAVRMALDGLGG